MVLAKELLQIVKLIKTSQSSIISDNTISVCNIKTATNYLKVIKLIRLHF